MRLIECCDGASRALYARAAARSAARVEWRVEWLYVADPDDPAAVADAVDDPNSRWAPGEASWLVRLENKLLVHFDQAAPSDGGARGGGGGAAAQRARAAPGVWAPLDERVRVLGAPAPDSAGAELLAALGLARRDGGAADESARWRARAAPPLDDALAPHAPMPPALSSHAVTDAQRAALEARVAESDEALAENAGGVKIEWIVDVADQGGVFHIGTAYAYEPPRALGAPPPPPTPSGDAARDAAAAGRYAEMLERAARERGEGTLLVAIPDLEAPSWQGPVRVDHRAVRLIECVDDASRALYLRLAARSCAPVAWTVALAPPDGAPAAAAAPAAAEWFVQLENKLLVREAAASGGAARWVES